MSAKKDLFDKAIRVWYRKLPASDTLWPLIDVGLKYKDIVFPQKILALVDSGASNSTLHLSLATILGFNLKKIKKDSGGRSASGSYKYWTLSEPVECLIYGQTYPFKFQVIDYPDLIWPCILGHDTLFRIAKLTFKSFKGYLDLSARLFD